MSKVYQVITDRIIESLKAGRIPWRQPWAEGRPRLGAPGENLPRNLISGRVYRGINLWTLFAAGYSSPYWGTFRQIRERGGHVRKGAHGWPVVFWRVEDREPEPGEADPEGREARSRRRFILRYSTAFNLEQVEGVAPPTPPTAGPAPRPFKPIEEAERIVRGFPSPAPPIREEAVSTGRYDAYYDPARDAVTMPERGRFDREEFWYATLFHELVHATGHPTRLHREDLAAYSLRDGSRPREELTAELGAAYLCAVSGIEPATLANQAAYVGTWLSHLAEDPRLVVQAGARAQRAADFILRAESHEGEETSEAASRSVGASS